MTIPQQMEIKILPFRLNGRIGEKLGFSLPIFKGLGLAFQIKYAETGTQVPMGHPKPGKEIHTPVNTGRIPSASTAQGRGVS